MTPAALSYPERWRPPRFIESPFFRHFLWLGAAIYLAAAFGTLDVDWTRVVSGLARGRDFVLAFVPPDFTSRGTDIVAGLMESLWMTITSTVVGILLSIPVAIGAARNIAPLPVYVVCRAIVAVARSFQEVILAILFVALFGFGPFAGFITLSVATVGFFAKLLAEDIEDMSVAQSEAVQATGAGFFQWLNYAVEPQVLPRFVGLSIYRLDINFRESAVVGIVGGGGIGATLNTAFERYEFSSAAAILLIIIGIVIVMEYLSGHIRRRVQ